MKILEQQFLNFKEQQENFKREADYLMLFVESAGKKGRHEFQFEIFAKLQDQIQTVIENKRTLKKNHKLLGKENRLLNEQI